ncbi:DNA mismatch repair protein MSH1, mitochondrial [Dendrobium catenatum]|uniref:DNA mismatch repair protein MSH1, mitochondrial n=1 Tax=Dendrobium catenatum TaxID=906689 RepID=A0A2I0VTV0_9ASPA|nr:DNA mismatch repair protein MSH1, mitochondrial [Dendrobium catenatum]
MGQPGKGAEPSGQQSQQLGQQPGLVESPGQHPIRVCQDSAYSWCCWTPWTAACSFPRCRLARELAGMRSGQQVEDEGKVEGHVQRVLGTHDTTLAGATSYMELTGLSPYWFDASQGNAIQNDVKMQSMFLLTGPNGGGKSSLLRSVCASVLLGICGLMVPAQSAIIPHFDAVMLHMKPYDSPADGKSSFQIEMAELRGMITGATKRSLVLVDEICRGTETAKGTCIAGSIVEKLDAIGCLGIVSTHLHGLFYLPLSTKNVIFKQMGIEIVDGHIKPTWKLFDGVCRESLAFETAQREGLPESIVRRAEELYLSREMQSSSEAVYLKSQPDLKESVLNYDSLKTNCIATISGTMKELQREVENTLTIICQRKLIEVYKEKSTSELLELSCFKIGPREQPPPSTVGNSCVYVLFRPDNKLYIGQVTKSFAL